MNDLNPLLSVSPETEAAIVTLRMVVPMTLGMVAIVTGSGIFIRETIEPYPRSPFKSLGLIAGGILLNLAGIMLGILYQTGG